ncbi:hypothetical protein CDES_08995 [Corynebacterium deserti GIMN1.010]|uniref:Or membrane protein n=1 Tax=Corynebacterium deserti GIMN1.010 TaxID=931089 RepID=A0A0M4CEE3_9CORY|nr:hypothetical protein [Corynebacterium deserti]ALC06191.1 hypothetical protein CDES_08995 [Corynebacterium deserti GIMN1.010]
MRKFRNTAIALVSAAAISLGGVTAATAQETDETTQTTEDRAFTSGSSWADYNEPYEGDQEGYGVDGFGSSRDDSGEDVPRWLSTWGKVFDVLTVGSVLGMIVFPVVNFLKYNGVIK